MGWLKRANTPEIVVYTDGSCLKQQGAGGWAAILLIEGVVTEMYGHEATTTNNRMEIMGALMALTALKTGSRVTVYTDSKYLRDGAAYGINRWKRKGWTTSASLPVVNRDLWELMDEQINRHIVAWIWVKGHKGDRHNNRCDELAGFAARNPDQSQYHDLTNG